MSTIILTQPELASIDTNAAPVLEPPIRRQTFARSVLGWALTIALLATWAVTLRPVALGGPTSIVGVNGISMTPTMHDGDLVVSRRESTYKVGDIIAYHVPAGDPGAGSNVIHRVIGGDGTAGYVTQGDHNSWTDTWHPRNGDVIGKVWIRVPRGVAAIKALKSPPVLAALIGLLAFVCILWPSQEKASEEDRDDPFVGSQRVSD